MQNKRGQIALSMLTRFAMLFFIMTLAVLMLNLSSQEKSSLCSSQAEAMSSAIAAQISQTLNAPIEDERKIYALTPSLSVGKDTYSKYVINITNHIDRTGHKNFFAIDISSEGGECRGHKEVFYNKTIVSLIGTQLSRNNRGDTIITLSPSVGKQGRSRNLIIIKCKPKAWGKPPAIYLEDCLKENSAGCMNFSSPQIEECCGWSNYAESGTDVLFDPQCTGEESG